MFLLIENPHKGNNLGAIIRCACAFGIQIVVAVGYEQYSAEGKRARFFDSPIANDTQFLNS
jgi:tRNA G18 (ribose-2'-O)-methylase SpoU